MRTWMVVGAAAWLGLTGLAAAQTSPESDRLGLRQLEAAERLEQSGQQAEARQAYETLLSRAPEGPWADEALLALARLACAADRPALGADGSLPCGVAQIGTALDRLRQLEELCPGREACAEGAWRRAVLRWLPSPTHHDPATARAVLTTFPVLYRESPRVPRALTLAAELHRRAGARGEAGRLAYQLLAGWPEHALAAEAWLVLARLEHEAQRPADALHATGRARQLAAGAAGAEESETVRRATGMATQLDRLTWAETRGERRWKPPQDGPALEDVADLAFDRRDRLVVALPRENTVLVLDAEGNAVDRRSIPEVESVAVDRWGRIWAAAEESLAAPPGLPFAMPDGARLAAVVPSGAGAAWLVDARHEVLHRIEVGRAQPRRMELPRRTEPVAAVGDVDGEGLWLLDARRARLERREGNGELAVSVDLEAVVDEPVDLALGPLGHVFVLDAEGPEVWVVTAEGVLLGYHRIETTEKIPWSEPTAIAVDSAGRLALYDERAGRIRWLR